MASMLKCKVAGATAFGSRAPKQAVRAVSCKAQATPLDRRSALSALALFPAVFFAPKALALIPDEEDEELVEKAKANRKSRLQQQRQTTREFLSTEGLKDVSDAKDLAPVQQAVFKLAECGSKLETGDVKAASASLSGAWVNAFASASQGLSTTDGERDQAKQVSDALDALKAVAGKGDLKGTKKQFVAAVSSLEGWASGAGLASSLKGL